MHSVNVLAGNLDFGYLSLTIGNISGRILTYNLIFLYRVIPQLEIVLGYTGLNFQVNAVKKGVSAELKWGYNGPTIGASFSFGKKSWVN